MKDSAIRDFGFVRVAVAVPKVLVGDFQFNAEQIVGLIKKAREDNVEVALLPELCVTGYTAGDLFGQEILLEKSKEALGKIIRETRDCRVLSVLGMPIAADGQLFNCAVLIQGSRIIGLVPKTYMPNYKEFYEKRWFSSAKTAKSDRIKILGQNVPFGADLLFQAANFPSLIVGVEICEDLWAPIPQSSYQALAGATLLLNLSASNEVIGKAEYRRSLVSQQSGKCLACYAYCSSGVGESTTDLVFGGHGIIAENGTILAESDRFSRENQLVARDIDIERTMFYRRQTTSFGDNTQALEKKFRMIDFVLPVSLSNALKRRVEPYPFVPGDRSQRDARCEEIFAIQVAGLAKRIEHGKVKRVLIGVSGGLDSTLALLVAVKTFELLGRDKKGIAALTMPGFGTSVRTLNNARKLCEALGVILEEIDIKDACLAQFKDIGQDPSNQNVTFENVQARYRTAILFNRGNQAHGLVLGTGDLSEIALGWCTYNGDHMSHYNVNSSIPKTLVKFLVRWAADTKFKKKAKEALHDILDTPISPELISENSKSISQKTEDIIGPYELHDFFLYYFVRWGMRPRKILFLAKHAFEEKYSVDEIKKWLAVFIKRFFGNQWKRSCMPDGPKVGSVTLSPRGDWRMPSDAEVSAWLEDLEDNDGEEAVDGM